MPSLAVDSQGDSHIVWTSDGAAWYMKVSEDGDVRVTPRVVSGGVTVYRAEIAVDTGNNAHVVCGPTSRVGLMYLRLDPTGATQAHSLVDFGTGTPADDSYSSPCIAVDPTSQLPVIGALVQKAVGSAPPMPMGLPSATMGLAGLASWLGANAIYQSSIYGSFLANTYEYIMAFVLDGGGNVTRQIAFSREVDIGFFPWRSDYPSIAVDGSGKVHCVWRFWNNAPDVGDGSRYVAYARENTTDQPFMLISLPDGIARASRPTIAFEPAAGKLHAVWHSPLGNGAVWYSRLSTAGELETASVVSSTDAVVWGSPALAVDDQLVRVVWTDRRNGQAGVYFAALSADTGAKVGEDIQLTSSAAASFNPAIASSPWGVPSIVWQDQNYGGNEILKFRPPWLWMVYLDGDTGFGAGGATPGHELYFRNILRPLELAAANPLATVFVQFDGRGTDDSRRLRVHYIKDSIPASPADYMAAVYDRYAQDGGDFWYVGASGVKSSPGEVDMADPATLTDFITWSVDQTVPQSGSVPSPHSFLAVIDHGNGWLPGFGAGARGQRGIIHDEHPTAGGSLMGLPALNRALADSGVVSDVLYLDACQMGLTEVAYQVRHRAQYVLFSQANSMPDPYGKYLDTLTASASAIDLARSVASVYSTEMGPRRDHTISALRCSKLESLADAVSQMTVELKTLPDLKQDMVVAAMASQKTDSAGRYSDLYGLCLKLREEIPVAAETQPALDAAEAVMDIIDATGDDRLVVAEHHGGTMADCHGLSIYFPFSRPDLDVVGTTEQDEEDPGAFISTSDETGLRLAQGAIRIPDVQQGIVRLERESDIVDVWWQDDAGVRHPVLTTNSWIEWDLSKETDRDTLDDMDGGLWFQLKDHDSVGLTLTCTGLQTGQPAPFTDRVVLTGVTLGNLTISNQGREVSTGQTPQTGGGREDSEAPVLYAVQDENGEVALDVGITWKPEHVDVSALQDRLRWQIRRKDGREASPSEWRDASGAALTSTTGSFAADSLSFTWTEPEGGATQREFEIAVWLDEDGDGQQGARSRPARDAPRFVRRAAVTEQSQAGALVLAKAQFDGVWDCNLDFQRLEDAYSRYSKCFAFEHESSGSYDLQDCLKIEPGTLGFDKIENQLSLVIAERVFDGSFFRKARIDRPSAVLEYDVGDPGDTDIYAYGIELRESAGDSVLDHLMLVIYSRHSKSEWDNWVDNASYGNAAGDSWLDELPRVYSRLGPEESRDPEPEDCDPQRWREVNTSLPAHYHFSASFEMRSERTPGGHGHQACYDADGRLVIPTAGNMESFASSGTADHRAPGGPFPWDHAAHDVLPFIRAAQMDGNPIDGEFLNLNLSHPLIRIGPALEEYYRRRPAHTVDTVVPGACCGPADCASHSPSEGL